jgi:hypothetical protein
LTRYPAEPTGLYGSSNTLIGALSSVPFVIAAVMRPHAMSAKLR